MHVSPNARSHWKRAPKLISVPLHLFRMPEVASGLLVIQIQIQAVCTNLLKYGFLKKSFIMNVPVAPPKVMTGNRQLTRGAFIRNDFLRNPHFRKKQGKL